jgi:hypothetical protein
MPDGMIILNRMGSSRLIIGRTTMRTIGTVTAQIVIEYRMGEMSSFFLLVMGNPLLLAMST